MRKLDRIRKIAAGFRVGMLDGSPSNMMCFAICAPLQALLGLYGYEAELIEGDFGHVNHFWLKLPDGTIIDPTADQFTTPDGKSMPPVYVGPLPDWYKANEPPTSTPIPAPRPARQRASRAKATTKARL